MTPRLHLSVPRGAAPGERRFGVVNMTKNELVLLDGAILIAIEQMRRDAETMAAIEQLRAAADLMERRADLQRLYMVVRDAQNFAP